MLHFYRRQSANTLSVERLKSRFQGLTDVQYEVCFNVELANTDTAPFSTADREKLLWLFSETFEPELTTESTSLFVSDESSFIVELGPRLAFKTAWSSNCSSICDACGIRSVGRIELSRRFLVRTEPSLLPAERMEFTSFLYDRMTECIYEQPLQSFLNDTTAEPVKIIDIINEGPKALEKANEERGLGFDAWDIEFYSKMFVEKLGRNPTDVECFDLAQSNSEHSRHWFFGGKMVIDGLEKPNTLFSMVKGTLSGDNSVIAFHDNSSSIRGLEVNALTPTDPGKPSSMSPKKQILHPILTAETHNFPTGVAPFAGAETGTGGRLRDVQATGRGAHSLAGISAYCVGNLFIPSHPLPWESPSSYPNNLARPLDIIVDASNGASDYGNKYGEPVVSGFTRSFGQRLPNGNRVEWIKPIMFTAGVGQMNSLHAKKEDPSVGMVVCKLGGPAYRIGMGGGAASSRPLGSDESAATLDFNAVQRGDAEMENRMNRVIRACIELGENNPIVSIHDQGAGGNGNVLKEICDPLGALLQIRSIPVGDPTLSVLEIWGAEYQENNAILVSPENLDIVQSIGRRENCPVSPVGVVTDTGRVVVQDSDGSTPFDLPLSLVLGKMPQKVFEFTTAPKHTIPLALPADTTPLLALERVLKLLDVGSKRFLTNKVDRSVTGLIAQQQCVGALQTPVADVAVMAQSHFDLSGIAVAVGEQPIKGLLNNAAQARMTVGECLTNMMFAEITKLEDVKASCNWMWAAKLSDEGSDMWQTCEALCDCLKVLGVSIDGGKDSLSMAAKVDTELVRAPGEVTLTAYAVCPDVTKTVTPDIKQPGIGKLVLVDLSGINSSGERKNRLGGSALSTVFSQLGQDPADVDDISLLKRGFEAVQLLVRERLILSGHDRSDGGLIVTVLEMAFAGNCGLEIDLPSATSETGIFGILFGEELGAVLEILPHNVDRVLDILKQFEVPSYEIGQSIAYPRYDIVFSVGGTEVLRSDMLELRMQWESTSFALEKLQCNSKCVIEEEKNFTDGRFGPSYSLTFDVSPTNTSLLTAANKHRVAIIRQEGTNGDREMSAAFFSAGLDPWDVNMNDLLENRIDLSQFRGVVFCGGFSFADCNDSAKGWAGSIRFNSSLLAQFEAFKSRSDTFSLGICNGCQLMALLGWVPFPDIDLKDKQPRFIHNESKRFESRWSAVQIMESPSILLKGMAGSTLGVWVAHGEGKAFFPDEAHLAEVERLNLAPVRYVDDDNAPTSVYPYNPNGSPNGIASLCSQDGRHLAMMPHPERCFLTWQWPYMPSAWKESMPWNTAPWLKMFQNARDFCDNN